MVERIKSTGIKTPRIRELKAISATTEFIPSRETEISQRSSRKAVPERPKQQGWKWYMPDGTIKEGKMPVPGENCEKIPDEVIYPKQILRYCTNPNCPSAKGQNEVMGNQTVWVAGTPALLEQQTVDGKNGTYTIAYFCPVCRTYQ